MIDPVAFTINLGSFSKDVYWYGVIIASAMLLAMILAMRNAKKLGYNPDMILDFSLFLIVFSVIGARLHYVIWCWDAYKDGPFWKVFAVWEGGLAIFGGILTGILVAFIYSRVKNISFKALLDIVAPSLILAQAIGRWGNFANQEAYGYQIVTEKFMHFPIAVFIQETGKYHMATFFYESMWNLLGFVILMIYMSFPRKKEGKLFYMYLMLYGFGRMIIEGFRMDSQMLFDTTIRVNQLIAFILFIIGVVLFIFDRNANEYEYTGDSEPVDNEEKRRKEKEEKDAAKKARKNNVEDLTKESVVDEYQAVREEMRKQRERNNNK